MDKTSALILAAEKINVKTVTMLQEAGASLNSALIIAVKNNNFNAAIASTPQYTTPQNQ